MKALISLASAIALGSPSVVSAAFMEIAATEMVTIQPPDSSQSPRLLVRWELPAGLDSLIIDGAGIVMDVARTGGKPAAASVFPLTTAWSPGDVGWSDGWTKAGGDFDPTRLAPAVLRAESNAEVKTDVTLTIKAMIAGKMPNFGFIVIVDEKDARLAAVSANSSAALGKARLVIAYRKRR
jgi:hypothetical protein